MKPRLFQAVGLTGSVIIAVIFVQKPSWPTPDKLVIFMTFVFMIFSQARAMLVRLAPFIGLLLVYESLRGLAPHLNSNVNYTFMPHFDKFVFGDLPTQSLQQLLWNGSVMWYDFVFYLAYMMHFVLPVGLALLIWKRHEARYWRYISAYLIVSFAGFITYVLFPAAPPWMAADKNYIEPIIRVSSDVWAALGLDNFPSFYNHVSPNPVAAVPSLHAAYATLFVLFIYKLFKKRWAAIAALYPLLIYTGTVYQGEHYVFDILAGIIYALGAYLAAPYVAKWFTGLIKSLAKRFLKLKSNYSSNTKNV